MPVPSEGLLLFRSSETDEFIGERFTPTSATAPEQPQPSAVETPPTEQPTADHEENSSMTVIIKFLNDTRKEILAHPNDTISKIKQ